MDDRAVDRRRHEICVRAWLHEAVDAKATPSTRAAVLRLGIHAVWQRARRTIGDVTLSAILHRVVTMGCRRFPELARIDMEMREMPNPTWDELIEPSIAADVSSALELVLVELLTVLGRLTGNALTTVVHAELRRTTAPPWVRRDRVHALFVDGDEL